MGFTKTQIKKITASFWGILILTILLGIIINPKSIEPEFLVNFIKQYQHEMLFVYGLLSLFRGLFLIPSTPFVIAGGLLFPHHPIWVLLISMTGIMCAAIGLYFFADWLGFGPYLEAKFPKKIAQWKKRLQHPKAMYFVIGWSFFPFVPTDMICYVAGLVKMPLKYFLSGIFIGELILVSCYVYFGKGLFALLS
ncbi:VTT domain-containing protein [Flavobacteriaceae bacterium F08102]|nr:VTT domain-containing protein [Flavobacteriaceae bacterium F08102]